MVWMQKLMEEQLSMISSLINWVDGGLFREKQLRGWETVWRESRNLFWTCWVWNDYWKSSWRHQVSCWTALEAKAEVRASNISVSNRRYLNFKATGLAKSTWRQLRWIKGFRTMPVHVDIWEAEQRKPRSVSKAGERPASVGSGSLGKKELQGGGSGLPWWRSG